MSVTYSGVANHPALSAAAKDEPDRERFLAQQQLAEMLLGLEGTALTKASDISKAEHAIALQVSFQYAQGLDAHVYSSLASDRMESRAFRGTQEGAALLHAAAKRLADQLIAGQASGAWPAGPASMRGPQG